ncbi:DUF5839 family protein [Rossellomorea vietnamensis]|uniref:DUF5839 family protein n=1 Tax=Rossellomorea vietnamensis TaxID=218284 RepID=UPI003CF55608
MENNNTLAGYHVVKNEGGIIELNTKQIYRWHIPQYLRNDPIAKGDIVLVRTVRGFKSVLVMNVFREEFEETQRRYKRVVKVLEKAPEPELAQALK